MEQTCNNTQQVGEQVGTGILSGDESGTGQVIAASHSQCGVDRSQRGGDEQHDDGEDHAGNIAADNIALAECDRVSDSHMAW